MKSQRRATLGLLLLFTGAISLYWVLSDGNFLFILALLYLAAALVAATADLISGHVRTAGQFLWQYLIHCLTLFRRAIELGMILPLIILELTAALALGAAVVSFGGLLIYFIEEMIGYDIKGYSWPGEPIHAWLFLLIFIGAASLFYLRVALERYHPRDKAVDLMVEGLQPLLRLEEKLASRRDR
jgi:hypothetical protein